MTAEWDGAKWMMLPVIFVICFALMIVVTEQIMTLLGLCSGFCF